MQKAYKYLEPNDTDEAKVNALSGLQLHPPIWKHYDKYY